MTPKPNTIAFFICILLAIGCGLRTAEAQPSGRLISFQKGDLPIILSAPHGGSGIIPGVPVRMGQGIEKFNPKSDSGTAALTEELADAIEQKLGKRPYAIIAKVHRKYVDVNRPPRLAYESDGARSTYEAYHSAIAQARSDVMERWGRGILIDVHGQALDPTGIFRGTQNGKTVKHLLSRFGPEALTGEHSVFGQLAAQGSKVIPAIDSNALEHSGYDGGFIVVNYGSAVSGTVDGIQLELGSELRASNERAATATKLANAITSFADEYLLMQLQPVQADE